MEKPQQQLLLSLTQHLQQQQPEGTKDKDNEIDSDKVHLILASQSPRRREILDMMGLPNKYSHSPSPLDEEELQVRLVEEHRSKSDVDAGTICPKEYTQTLAEEKAKALAESICVTQPTLVLGSDTIVDWNDQILEKPKSVEDAKIMLSKLSGQHHSVHTGVAIYKVMAPSDVTLVTSFTDTADVTFAPLTDADIDSYIETGEPMDKAGSYGIQGIGGQFVSNVSGDFFTVMGLPMHRTSLALASALSSILKL